MSELLTSGSIGVFGHLQQLCEVQFLRLAIAREPCRLGCPIQQSKSVWLLNEGQFEFARGVRRLSQFQQ